MAERDSGEETAQGSSARGNMHFQCKKYTA